jgi:molybdopterin synthase catalytic subunit/molybdopterin converting factor small subunit
VKELAGMAEEVVEAAPGSTTESLFSEYLARFPKLVEMRSSILVARNQQFVRQPEPLAEGDEIALLPPVSGGSGGYLRQIADAGGNFVALTRDPIDSRILAQQIQRPEDGAVVHFEGVVRNNTGGRPAEFLVYECYEPMAVEAMAAIAREIAEEFDIGRMAVVHRLGRLEIGETSIAIVVSAPHRQPAFAAALEAINRVKRRVPIWKKEYSAGGEVWVEGDWDESLLSR